MKPKSALFISTVLTAFVIAILAGVISALNMSRPGDAAAPASTQVQATDVATQPDASATAPVQISPQQAASIASQFLKKTDVYSVEGMTLNGANAYKVVFSSGDVVYVGLDGQILTGPTATPAPTISYTSPLPTPQKRHNNGGGGGGGGDDNEDDDH